jgi:DNA-binding transcriptional LysR family regulator
MSSTPRSSATSDDRPRPFHIRTLSRNKMAAVLPEDHALAKQKSIKLAALKDERWVSLSDAFFPGRREFCAASASSRALSRIIVSEVDSLSMMLGAVTAGEGVAVMPAHAGKLPHGGCVIIPLAAPVPTSELLLVLPKQEPSRELNTLTTLIAELAAQLAQGQP